MKDSMTLRYPLSAYLVPVSFPTRLSGERTRYIRSLLDSGTDGTPV